ncbi:MAG: molecular chaperone DnaK [Candidatus Aminicenantes bacterium]|nr:molecular chaperone DnaK [Candidatus Aminicenantes bacterium]
MGPVIGIDLGTTYSCIAHLSGDQPRVIPNLEGSSTTPSVVGFTSAGETVIGETAVRQALTNPEKTLFAVKRLIGRKFRSEEVQKAAARLPYKLAEAPNGDVLIEIGRERITPQEVSAMILGYLKTSAESYFGEDVHDAVITVPAHFGDHQRQATRDAAVIAGLNVLRVINEPTAAGLAFGLGQKKNGKVAVFDLGGGTFDISLLEIQNGVFHVLATNGDSYLGGADFDQRIVDWLLNEFKKDHAMDLISDKFALQRVREAAERAKRELSFTNETEINLPFILALPKESLHLRKTMTQALLESLTGDLAQKTLPLIQQTLDEVRLKPEAIDDVLLVGGQTRMPLIRRRVSEFFHKRPNDKVHPEESVALGAAIQSGMLFGELNDIVLLLDVTSLALGIETELDGFERIIGKNTTIPVKKTKSFTTVDNNQRQVLIHILQGDAPRASENVSLAKFELVGILPAPAGVPEIDVTFEIDANGQVKVAARDMATGKEQMISVQPSSGLSKQQVSNLVKKQRDKKDKDAVHE